MLAVAVPINQNNITPVQDIGVYVSKIAGVILIVASLAAFLYLVLGGLQWIMAGGDKGKIEESRNRITNALIGLAITAAGWAVFLLINYFFGLGIVGGKTSTFTGNSSFSSSGNKSGRNSGGGGGGGGETSTKNPWQFHCGQNDTSCASRCSALGSSCRVVTTGEGPGCWCP